MQEKELESLEKAGCVRCGKPAGGTKGSRCKSCMDKLTAKRHTPGSKERAWNKADGAARRDRGDNGTAHPKATGRMKDRKAFVKRFQNDEKKTGQKLSPDRKQNNVGYTSSNVRNVKESLNRGRHHVDGKKLSAWRKRLKKSETSNEEFYTYVLAKATADNNEPLMSLLRDMHPDDLANYIDNTESTFNVEVFAKNYVEKYQRLQKSTEVSLFKRYEDKFILPLELKSQLEGLLKKHMTADYPTKDTKYNFMKSTYFDSADLDMVKQHLNKSQSRFKIRTREYAPNGKLNKSDFTYLEVKAKHGDVSDKFRIKVPNANMEAFKSGKPIITDIKLAKANPHVGVADLVKRVDDINNAMSTFSLRPSCEVSYVRKAFASGDFRVTFDEGVESAAVGDIGNSLLKNDPSMENMSNGYCPDKHIILEVKHQGTTPDWLTQFLTTNNVAKTNFSKYCYSVGKLIKKSN